MNALKPSFTRYARDAGILPEDFDEDVSFPTPPTDLEAAERCMEEERTRFPSTLSASEIKKLTDDQGWRLLYIDANNCKHDHILIIVMSIIIITINISASPSSSSSSSQKNVFFSVYGSAMTLPLPVGDYEFLKDDDVEVTKLRDFFIKMECSHLEKTEAPDWTEYFPDSSKGYYLECDVTFPIDRHEKLSNFPPCPTRTKITEDDVSSHFKQAWRARYGEGVKMPDCEKLCASLTDKKSVVLHSENAIVYSRIGAKIVVKKVLRFRQERILQRWVEFATEGRRKASLAGDQLLVDCFKLCVNSLFGKFIENLLLHHRSSIVLEEEKCLNELGSPFLKDFVFLEDGSLLFQHYLERMEMNRPTILGVSILELSKCLTYDYYYNVLKKCFGARVELLYTDTDSFVVRIFTDSLEKELKCIEKTLDTSNFDKKSNLYSLKHAKQLFKWKSEIPNTPILLFLALRPKCYMILTQQSLDHIKQLKESGVDTRILPTGLKALELRNKGIDRGVCRVMGPIPFLISIYAKSFITATSRKIENCGSKPHFVEITKACLSFIDNKSRQKSCFIHSIPYGSDASLDCTCLE